MNPPNKGQCLRIYSPSNGPLGCHISSSNAWCLSNISRCGRRQKVVPSLQRANVTMICLLGILLLLLQIWRRYGEVNTTMADLAESVIYILATRAALDSLHLFQFCTQFVIFLSLFPYRPLPPTSRPRPFFNPSRGHMGLFLESACYTVPEITGCQTCAATAPCAIQNVRPQLYWRTCHYPGIECLPQLILMPVSLI